MFRGARTGAWGRLAGFLAALSLIGAFVGTAGAGAVVEVPFATQYAASARGGVAIAANTLMTCPADEALCPEAQAGTATGGALNNNNHKMERVDIDADLTTFDSSSATLSIPAGATVQFAGLYYGARTSRGTEGEAAIDPNARGTVLLQTPGALTYSPLTAVVDDSAAVAGSYAAFVDVTAQVAAAGSGEYAVANVQSGTGVDRYAGWSLVVVYSDPASPPRSIQVFDGLASIVANEAPLQIPVTGLETPPSGTVTAEAGIVAYEGDRGGNSSDRLLLAGRELSDAANPPNNVFNSTISAGGANVTAKNPNYDNQLGFDSDLIQANGFLGNGVTETTLEESTGIEQYLTQAIVLAVELDPAVLEPPAPPAPPAPPPATPQPEPAPVHHRKGVPKKPQGPKESGDKGPQPVSLHIDAPKGAVRPTAVVPVSVTVEASAAPIENLQVCNRLSPGLTRLRAPGARVKGNSACWQVSKLARGKRRTFKTTARVDATSVRTLVSRTVVSARGARTVRRATRIHVAPLPSRACGSSLRVAPGVLQRC